MLAGPVVAPEVIFLTLAQQSAKSRIIGFLGLEENFL